MNRRDPITCIKIIWHYDAHTRSCVLWIPPHSCCCCMMWFMKVFRDFLFLKKPPVKNILTPNHTSFYHLSNLLCNFETRWVFNVSESIRWAIKSWLTSKWNVHYSQESHLSGLLTAKGKTLTAIKFIWCIFGGVVLSWGSMWKPEDGAISLPKDSCKHVKVTPQRRLGFKTGRGCSRKSWDNDFKNHKSDIWLPFGRELWY